MSKVTIAERTIVHEHELVRPLERAGFVRAICHLHGGDHQRSLSIASAELGPDRAGFGSCFACGAEVFVPEMNPEAAARMAGAQAGQDGPRPRRRLTLDALRRETERKRARSAAAASQASPSASESSPSPEQARRDAWHREELELLAGLDERMRGRLAVDPRARTYLEEARRIPLELAEACGVGYIPAGAAPLAKFPKWRERLMFPLASPEGRGYIGRSVHGWRPGMDENAHKDLLDAGGEASPRRWEKTYPAGWFNFDALAAAEYAVIVEGPVDALALMAAGLTDPAMPVVALVNRMAAHVEWLPPDDGQGKDWAERWRLAGLAGVWPVLVALDELRRGATRHNDEMAAQGSEDDAAAAADETPATRRAEAPWLLDPVVQFLLAHGLELAEAHMLAEAS